MKQPGSSVNKHMRIIKLSQSDPDMATAEMVDAFFGKKLKERKPKGKFRLTKGRFSEDGIITGDRLLFTYLGDCIYQARSASGRVVNEDEYRDRYPHYFCIDMDSLVKTEYKLQELEDELTERNFLTKKLVGTQAWPSVDDKRVEVSNLLNERLGPV